MEMNTLTTDWKALCTELAKVLAEEYGVQREFADGDPLLGSGAIELLSRARAALFQPEPEVLEPGYIDPEHKGQDRELLEVFYKACRSEGGSADEIHLRGLKAVIALSQPKPQGPTVMEINALADEITAEELGLVDLVHRALARWGRPATPTETP